MDADALIAIVERALYAAPNEWLFLRELRVGIGIRRASLQRLDAFALNTYPHTGMRRVCYEVKISRADFLSELKHPLKRRIGLRYANEFYFVMPADLVEPAEIPPECGLVEAGTATPDEWRVIQPRQAGFFHYDADAGTYCVITVPAPWRDTPAPTWQFAAAMMRHQKRELEDRPPVLAPQQKLEF